ncbi:MAG: adenylate/guanylate cyclase domain-containing protein, partial [Planctomycetota bacterium]|nr:adenylate/guanylate cyclase domain-containing protein [Planctomycetota bacterium]
ILAAAYILMFRHYLLLNVSYPLLAGFAVMLAVTTLNYFFEGQQRRYISSAFSRYLAPELVKQLAERPELLTLEGTQKDLTVLFSDIRDFTSLAENMSARELSAFLNEYLTPMTGVILERRGTVDKFIGDAIMAFWGAPLANPDHAVHACRAALAMVERLSALQPRWQARGLPAIRIGIGINTGIMSVGNMGSAQRFSYTVIGDNVNLASRLEGLNKVYGTTILLAESTRQAIGERFFCRLVDRVRVKGRGAAVAVYDLLLEGEPPASLREEMSLFAKAVAAYQAREFQTALRLCQDLQARRPHPLYAVYQERAQHYLAQPPPPDWDGVYEATSK